MKRPLLAILFAAAISVSGTSTTYAIHTSTSITDVLNSTVSSVREQTTRTTNDNSAEDKKVELETRKQELEQKLADKRAAISQKLMGARAEKCQAKQVNINSMLDKRAESAQKHFDKFKAIQDRLVTLVNEKELDVENHGGLENIMTRLQIEAQAKITSLSTNNFDCGEADATAPGSIVKDQVTQAKQALKNYRDAIKDYAVAIKASVNKTAEAPAETQPTLQEAPAEDTPSTEQSMEGAQQ